MRAWNRRFDLSLQTVASAACVRRIASPRRNGLLALGAPAETRLAVRVFRRTRERGRFCLGSARTGFLGSLACFALVVDTRQAPLHADGFVWGVAVAGLLLALMASPELRMPHLTGSKAKLSAGCFGVAIPVELALRRLKETDVWDELREDLVNENFSDQWRVGCWRLFAFEASRGGASATAVFAVRLAPPREAITAVLVDDETDQILDQRASGSFSRSGARRAPRRFARAAL